MSFLKYQDFYVESVNLYIKVNGLGKKIKDLRMERGLTQSQLAAKIGVSMSAVSLWESDINEPKAGYVLKLSEIFCVSADYLLGKDNFR